MSATLKDRLKRSRRSFTSPLSVVKRLKVDEDELPHTLKKDTNHARPADKGGDQGIRNEDMKDHKDFLNTFGSDPPHPSSEVLQHREQLKKDVKEKAETLRRLRMVKMYRSKNDLAQLQGLIDKWRRCAQAVLYELQTELPTDARKACLSQLIDHFGLEDRILHFNRTEEDFTNN
ncbi:swi5-dependent recombination DNA repair protein 1 homolog isoform X2 [Brachyhypopomus gauderio]